MLTAFEADDVKKRLYPIFKNTKPVRRVVLFGSVARGSATERSDVDLVVDTHGELLGIGFYELLYDVTEALGSTNVDMFEACEVKPNSPLARGIEEEGVVIYE